MIFPPRLYDLHYFSGFILSVGLPHSVSLIISFSDKILFAHFSTVFCRRTDHIPENVYTVSYTHFFFLRYNIHPRHSTSCRIEENGVASPISNNVAPALRLINHDTGTLTQKAPMILTIASEEKIPASTFPWKNDRKNIPTPMAKETAPPFSGESGRGPRYPFYAFQKAALFCG